jgi:hypothetical protein
VAGCRVETGSLCSSGWPRTHHPPASASQLTHGHSLKFSTLQTFFPETSLSPFLPQMQPSQQTGAVQASLRATHTSTQCFRSLSTHSLHTPPRTQDHHIQPYTPHLLPTPASHLPATPPHPTARPWKGNRTILSNCCNSKSNCLKNS